MAVGVGVPHGPLISHLPALTITLPERSREVHGVLAEVGVYPYAGMPVVGFIRTQLLIVLIHRDRYRPRTQGESMAEEGAQRPSGDALHQRVGRIVGAQATGDRRWSGPC